MVIILWGQKLLIAFPFSHDCKLFSLRINTWLVLQCNQCCLSADSMLNLCSMAQQKSHLLLVLKNLLFPHWKSYKLHFLTFLNSSQIHHMLHRTKCSTALTLPFKRTRSTFCIGPCLDSAVVYFSIMNCKQSHAHHRIWLLQQTHIRKQYEFTDSMLDCTHFQVLTWRHTDYSHQHYQTAW